MRASSLVLVLAVYVAGLARLWRGAGVGQGVRRWEAAAFVAGWAALLLALAPPMDRWSDTWLAAHMIQHELMIVVAAPLMAAGSPLTALLWALPRAWRRSASVSAGGRAASASLGAAMAPGAAWLLQAIALWAWHLPKLYDLAVAHDAVHALEHISFFGTALIFWWTIGHGRYGRLGYGAAVVYVFATALQSGLLGALLTFSPRVWFAAYAAPHGYGLSPLEDQQLAGLLMWVPAGLLLAAGGLFFLAAWLCESERRSALPFHTTPL